MAVADYRRLWAIGAGVGIARWLEFLGLGIFAFELTGSPSLVALIAIVRMVPYVMTGFLVGALADIYDRRRLMLISFSLATTASIILSAVTLAGLASYGMVLVAAAISGLVWTTDMPVRRRLLVDSVGIDNMASALGFDNSTTYATRALGPVMGGIIYQWLGPAGIFGLSGIVFATCLTLSWRLTVPPTAETAGRRITSIASLLPPMAMLRSRAFLIVGGITVVYNVFCFPFVTMVPVISQKDFLLEPILVGALSSCDGVGGTLGALTIGMIGSRRALFSIYFVGVSSFLALMFALSYMLTAGATLVAMLLIGVAAAAFSSTQFALVYSLAPPDMRGRATGLLSIFIGTSTIGLYHTGVLFEHFPSAYALWIMALEGLVLMFVLGLLWLRLPVAERTLPG
jgi:MFS family permease